MKKKLLENINIQTIKTNLESNDSNKSRKEEIQKNNKLLKKRKINRKELEDTLNKLLKLSNKNYKINYIDKKNKDPAIWELTIIGPKNTPYEGNCFTFRIDFSKEFEYITDNIKLENEIYHLNFAEIFNIEYDKNLTFYENCSKLFSVLYNLFIKPNCEISSNFSKRKIELYKNNRKEYNEIIKNFMMKIKHSKKELK